MAAWKNNEQLLVNIQVGNVGIVGRISDSLRFINKWQDSCFAGSLALGTYYDFPHISIMWNEEQES